MGYFRLWGRWEQIGPGQFVAIVSAVPEGEGTPEVLMRLAASLDNDRALVESMARELGAKIASTGARVIDVEID